MSKTNKAAENSEHVAELIKKWQGRLEAAQKNQLPVFKKAKENYEIYYAQINSEQRAKSPWKSNVFLPLLPGKARDVKAKMSILEPRFRVIPADSWQVDGTGQLTFDEQALSKSIKVSKKLNREFTNYTATGELPPRASLDFCNTDAIVAGWGLALAPLKTYNKVYKTKAALKDENGKDSAYTDDKTITTKTLRRVSTELIPLDIFRSYLSSKAKSWETSPWYIFEREASYADLEKCNSDQGEMIYDLPASLKDAKPSPTKNQFASVRDVALGYQADGSDYKDDSVNMFNVYDCYDQDTNEFFTFVEAAVEEATSGWIMPREMDNPYNHGLVPVIPFHVKRRPNSPWGESFFEISADVQHAYNAGYNQFSDNSTLSSETMALVDKNSIVGGYEISPGNTITYDSLNGEKPEPWKLIDPNPAVFTARMSILEKNAENGTTPQYTSGQVDSKTDKTSGTRGGIEMLMEAANDKMAEMYRNLKGSLLRYGYIAMHNAQQYQNYIEVLDTPDLSASGQQNFNAGKKITADYLAPMELQEAFDIEIDDESLLPLNKSERRRMYLDFINTLIAFQKSSIEQSQLHNTPEDLLRLDWPDIMKELGAQFGELNAPAFIKEPITAQVLAEKKVADAQTEQSATDAAAQVAKDNNPEAEIEQTPNGLQVQRQKRELSNFKDYPADVKNEVLASYGYPASQLVDEEARAQVAEARSSQLDVSVKEQMIQAANAGKLDPSELAKFIKK